MPRDKVWALHDFEAENPDEVSFKAGECILVVEKDDAYGDGWWQVSNTGPKDFDGAPRVSSADATDGIALLLLLFFKSGHESPW